MADDKKYYYLKLKDNFFDTDEMIILENMQDGYMYSNILLKLYLRSLKNDGRLMFNDRIPFNSSMLASLTRHNVGVIEKAMSIFRELNLIEVLDNGAIYVLDIQNFIGQSSTEADRKRIYRSNIEKEKKALMDKCPDKSPPELELELDLEKEKDIRDRDIKTIMSYKQDDAIPYSEIIDYLNLRTGAHYQHTTQKTRKLIKARFKEKFTLDDFKIVIDKKTIEWINNPDMAGFLRPETLFGTKFESYLNQQVKKPVDKYQALREFAQRGEEDNDLSGIF